jgi:hypothetical protein
MGNRSWRRLASALAISAACITASTPSAAGDDAKARARELALRGIRELKAGNPAQALELLDKAEGLFHAPPHWLFIARAHASRGDLVRAHDSYQRLVNEKLESGASDAFTRAQQDAKNELRELHARIARLQLHVSGASSGDVFATIDGVAFGDWQRELAVSSGRHVIEITAPGSVPIRKTVMASEGELTEVKMALAPQIKKELDAAPPKKSLSKAIVAGAAVSFSVAGAGAVVGAVTGVLALQRSREVESRCQGSVCLASDQGLAVEASRLGWISTASFAAGAAGLVAGITVVAVGAADRGNSKVTAEVGPQGIRLLGSF